ncbi:MAG: 6,7-dimethyl-8-ribityllumazine synthase [Hyphomonadaceae bacterium]|nr:6,7-dimethyl-8-ribityllumazine synthase [Hyphomonadaceae bacterium]
MKTSDKAAVQKVPGARILIVAAYYYRDIVDQLVTGAKAAIEAAGAEAAIIDVPGAFEIPTAISWRAKAGRPFDGYIALGCVIRGETSHYDYVCGESARALMDLGVRDGIAIGYGILTVENEAQAKARADISGRDKGGEAARACLALVALRRDLLRG